jgi:aspartyl-tRNA(Asn)/glutamyl-tRNA(Gln) amidotransferase subunit A
MNLVPVAYSEIRRDLLAGKRTCVEIVQGHLDRIDAYNAKLNAFLTVYDQEALARAAEIDAKIKQGTAGSLAGMVVGIKDLLCYADHPSQAGSQILNGFQSTFSATAVQRLLDADAIIIGRQNCDEFGNVPGFLRDRYRWFDSYASSVLWYYGLETNVWSSISLGLNRLCFII